MFILLRLMFEIKTKKHYFLSNETTDNYKVKNVMKKLSTHRIGITLWIKVYFHRFTFVLKPSCDVRREKAHSGY